MHRNICAPDVGSYFTTVHHVKLAVDVYDGLIEVLKDFAEGTIDYETFTRRHDRITEDNFLSEKKPRGPYDGLTTMQFCDRCCGSGHSSWKCDSVRRDWDRHLANQEYWEQVKVQVKLFMNMLELSREKRYVFFKTRFEEYKDNQSYMDEITSIEETMREKEKVIKQKEAELERAKAVYYDDAEIKKLGVAGGIQLHSKSARDICREFSS